MIPLQQQIENIYDTHRYTKQGFICYYDVNGRLRDIRYSSEIGKKYVRPLYYDRSSMRVAVKQSDYSWNSPTFIEVVEWDNRSIRERLGRHWACYGTCSRTLKIKELCYKHNCSPDKAIIKVIQENLKNKIAELDVQRKALTNELDSLVCCIETEYNGEDTMIGNNNRYDHCVLLSDKI